MEVRVTWDDSKAVAIVNYIDAKIHSEVHYNEWKQKLLSRFDQVLDQVGQKFPLIVCIDQLSFSSEFESRYGKELAPMVAQKYASAIARYGKNVPTKMVVSNQAVQRILEHASPESLRKEYGANVFQTQDDALVFIPAITNNNR
ncbi:MAG: hypothetical protein R8G66_18240 [Cytophagales bacterium]|nr:hypothetical protein [Cytophagales bacterium]